MSRTFDVVASALALALSVAACSHSLDGDIDTATLTWSPVTKSTDGKKLTNLAGYKIYYGNSPNRLNNVIKVPDIGLTTYQVSNLSHGTWYFAVAAYSNDGKESELSPVVSKTVR